MTGLLDATKQRWRLIVRLGPWEIFHARGPNQYHWSDLCVRLVDGRSPKRSWWLSYNHVEQRLSRRPYADDLFTRHPDIAKQLMLRLRSWQP